MLTANKHWTVGAYAKHLGIGVEKVLNWIATGELVAINVAVRQGGRPRWRISQDAIDKFEAARTATPATKPAARRRKQSRPAGYVEFFPE